MTASSFAVKPGSYQHMPRQQWLWALMTSARVPETVSPQTFGQWTLSRVQLDQKGQRYLVGWTTQTRLHHYTEATAYNEPPGETVMEDSWIELRKHLPLWRAARGRILLTGLGLGRMY